MRKQLSRRNANLLLSALVLAWGIVPPAIRHGHHEGGDRDHRHDAVARDCDDHGAHGHKTEEHAHDDALGVSPGAQDRFVVHLHWRLFGIDFSVPVPKNGQQDEENDDAEPSVVRLVDSVPTLTVEINGFAGAFPETVSQLGLDSPMVESSPSRPPSLVPSVPLCDRARHERSGVLLA